MQKRALVKALVQKTGLPRPQIEKFLHGFTAAMEESLAKDEKIVLAGLGTFSLSHRSERIGRHPKTGKPIKIAAQNVPHFHAAIALKRAVNR